MAGNMRRFGVLGIAVAAILGVALAGTSFQVSHDQLVSIAEQYITGYSNLDLEIAEIMELSNHYYVKAKERSTGRYAFEFLIDRLTGRSQPEPGPNMVWNTKYGQMSGGMMGGGMMGYRASPTRLGPMRISSEEALVRAQEHLDRYIPGLAAGKEGDAFYGYYTFHTLRERDGEIVGMLSVNGHTGGLWIHSWHGYFLGFVGEEH